MKMNWKALSVVALAGIMMLGSCKKNEENTTAANGDGILHAGIVQPNNGSKTSLDPTDGTIMWSAGDQIKVNGSSESGTFTLVEGTDAQDGTFRCPLFPVEEQTYLKAAYPAANATISGNEVTFNMPAEQTLTAGTFANGANPMVAYCEGSDALTFKSVMGGVQIQLAGKTTAPIHVTKLELIDANGAKLWGQFQVADLTAVAPAATYVSGGSSTLTLNLPEGGVTVSDAQVYDYYVVLPVGALANGFTMKAYDGDFEVKTATTDNTTFVVAANTIKQYVKFEAELPAGQANTPEAVMALAASGTNDITITSGELDFGGASITNHEIIIPNGATVGITNLSVTKSGAPAMEIGEGATVTLDNVDLSSTTRGLALNEDNATVTITGCTIEATGSGADKRGISVYGKNATLSIDHSTISSPYYAINITGHTTNSVVTVSNNTFSAGWAAINLWGPNNTVNATDCIFEGLNDKDYNADGWNNFSTITINHDGTSNNATNARVEFDNCTINAQATTGNKQWAIDVREPSAQVTLKNHTSVTDTDEHGNHNNPSTSASIRFYPGGSYVYTAFLSDPDLSEVTSQFVIDATVTETWWNLDSGKGSFNSKTVAAPASNDDRSKEK